MTFLLFVIDKKRSIAGSSARIPEVTLISLIDFGGFLGGMLGMYVLRHKSNFTAKPYFAVSLFLSWILHFFILFFFWTVLL